jgi:hypothetical protein
MCTSVTHIGIVLSDTAGQAADEVRELLAHALQKRINGRVCVIQAAGRGKSSGEIAEAVIKSLEQSGIIPVIDNQAVYTDEEEEKVRKRLEDLGYL